MELIPERLARGLESLARWSDAGVVLVPIRHHSPGCSLALTALLEEVRPATVLIEGAREFGALLPALADERTRPPIAVLSLRSDSSAYYPLAEFSPEWVALRWGAAHDAVVDFIDRSWATAPDESADPGARVLTLQAERHLADSAAIARLARRLGCRDHDEVWEHLFETRSPERMADWRGFTADALAWASLARIEADRELLDGDGTHAREAVMSAMIERHRGGAGPTVVVTGAFHSLGLLDALDDTAEGRWITSRDPGDLDPVAPAWLIRYDHDRLDGLRGYGAGMPAPGFWQRAWELRRTGADADGRELPVAVLLELAERMRAAGLPVGTPEVVAAAEQALRLATLRGRAWPGRTDLADAVLSCFVRDEAGISGALDGAIAEVFGGTALGELPPGVASPPVVAEARAAASRLRFAVDDARARTTSLDTARVAAHRARREFLATMRFVGSGFCRQTGGADLIGGTGLGQFFEEWEYAWTPHVEAALIEASADGATLAELCRHRVAARLERAASDPASIARLVAELAVMGASEELAPALARLGDAYAVSGASLASVVGSLNSVVGLVAEGARLRLEGQADGIRALVDAGLAAAAFALGPLSGVADDDAAAVCTVLVELRTLLRRLGVEVPDADATPVRRELERLRDRRDAAARVHGCLVGCAIADGELTPERTRAEIDAHLHPGADPDRLGAFLAGLLQAAPDLVIRESDILERLNERIAEFEPDAFLRVLPDLRQAFTWLRPGETARVAEAVAGLTGASAAELDAVFEFRADQADEAMRLERMLLASLARDGLTAPLEQAAPARQAAPADGSAG